MKEKLNNEILSILEKNQYTSVEDLAKALFVSPSTIRRALNELQEKGLAIRTHGGAKISRDNNPSPSFTFRIHQKTFEKKKIALSAIKLIKDGDIIFLDGTTSAFYIAEYLNEFNNIRVITNGIETLSLLSKNGITAYSTGGQISTENPAVLVGKYAEDTLNNFHANVAFFSAQSLDNDGNIYDCYENENFIRRTMMKNAKTKVFLCDDTKIGKTSPYYLCSINEVDFVATNSQNTDIIPTEKILNI